MCEQKVSSARMYHIYTNKYVYYLLFFLIALIRENPKKDIKYQNGCTLKFYMVFLKSPLSIKRLLYELS